MNQAINLLLNKGLRQLVTVFLTVMIFLVIPAFSSNTSLQAQAQTLAAVESKDNYLLDKKTAEKITERAEDHVGDRGSIGNTGLKNIRKLGENIPETAKVIYGQRFDNDQTADKGAPNVVKDVQRRERD